MRHFIVGLLPLGLLGGVPSWAQVADPAPVIAAERAFAADAPGMGIGRSFNKWAAPNAVVIGSQGVQRISDAYPPDEPRSAEEPLLAWWPVFAGIARSGDLGFTTGGVEVGGRRSGHYFTIWQMQADGSWKWIYDGGSGASAAGVPGPDVEPALLRTASRGSVSPDVAMAEVRAAEQTFAETARTDQKLAHLNVLIPEARLYVAPLAPAIGIRAITEALDRWPATFEFGPTESGGASQAGDMVWTYGPAAWIRDGQPREGRYVRLWQRQATSWGLVFAQLIPAAQAPSPASAG